MKFERKSECRACKGTGLYVGMAEGPGAAVVCYKCKGTGCEKLAFEYEPFTGRRDRDDVRRVYESGFGIMIGENKELGFTLERFGGVDYADWKSGKGFPLGSEMREFVCPKHHAQSTRGAFDQEKCFDSLGSTFSKCPHFACKGNCWAEYDKQHAERNEGKRP